jgi:alkylation response protein AidB-like acyl-CoA dehydrogenase
VRKIETSTRTHFDQVAALKRAGFGTLRLPEHLGGAGFTVPQLFSAMIDVAHADPIVAHIFRTHFWFVEERLRTADDASSARWLHKVAEGKIFGNAFSEKGSLAVGNLISMPACCPPKWRLPAERREVLQHRHAA